jgi:hypothetical protein
MNLPADPQGSPGEKGLFGSKFFIYRPDGFWQGIWKPWHFFFIIEAWIKNKPG